MGILDEAIREHLELKRSHGASEEEVRRQEAEVFGPVRQDAAPEPASDEPAGEEQDHAVPDAHDHLHLAGADPAWGEDTELFAERAEPPEEHGPPVAEAGGGMLEGRHVEPGPPLSPDQMHRHGHDEEHPALVDHDRIHSEEHPPEPVFGHASTSEGPTAPPADGEQGEDVLEETPEFLQDAPEHDRLWFEQKPPRDFDFDE